MIAKIETPHDELTGLPYCFAPYDGLSPVLPPGENIMRLSDWNHQFPQVEVKYGDNPALDELGRMALLGIRVQWVDYEQHHYRYNPQYIGPKQPQTREKLFTTLIMGEAGYIPEMAIDLSGDQPENVWLSPGQRRFFWESGQVKVRDPASVRKYLFHHVFQQNLDHIKPNQLDEFLHTTNLDRRIYLGHCLAAKIVERAVEPAEEVYRQARKGGMLPEYSATHVRDFVKPRLTVGRRFGPVFSELHKRLGSYNRIRKAQLDLAA